MPEKEVTLSEGHLEDRDQIQVDRSYKYHGVTYKVTSKRTGTNKRRLQNMAVLRMSSLQDTTSGYPPQAHDPG